MILNSHFMFVAMIILHILRTNGIVLCCVTFFCFIKLTWFSGHRLIVSMSGTIKQLQNINCL